MAQQLATLRTPAAYAGVTRYAQNHSGEAAAAAYLALGHAYLLDKRYAEAVASFRQARQAGAELADYADFLAARANHEAGNEAAAEALLHGFTERYPDSIFVAQAPELEANTLLAMKDAAGAQRVLAASGRNSRSEPSRLPACAGRRWRSRWGRTQEAEGLFKQLLLGHPLSSEAEIARAKLTAMGAETSLTHGRVAQPGRCLLQRRPLRGGERAIPRAGPASRASTPRAATGFAVAAAACDLKLKRLTTAEAEALPDTHDENGARRLYLLMELARNRDDLDEQKRIVAEMESRFPQSPWLAEALYSQRQHVSAAARVCDGGRVLQLSGHALSRRARTPRRRTGGRAG